MSPCKENVKGNPQGDFVTKTNVHDDLLLSPLSDFYSQILKCWHQIYTGTPTSYLEILQEKLCNNTLIRVGSLLGKSSIFLTKNGKLCLSDIVDNNMLLSRELNEKNECCIPVLSYNSLICSKPSVERTNFEY